MSRKELFRYSEENKEEFLKSDNITFNDGTVVTPEEIWHYLTVEAPVKYPNAYEINELRGSRRTRDEKYVTGLKSQYLSLTLSERMEKAKDKGKTVAFIQGGQAVDPYTAADTIALRPALVNNWNSGRKYGETVYERNVRTKGIKERAYHDMSFEACQTGGFEHIQAGDLRVDVIAPYSALRCSDVSYGLEAHRHGPNDKVKLFLGDYPMRFQADKEWAIEYFAHNIRKLIETLDEISGKKTTEEDLKNSIKLHNEGRKLAIEASEIWWSAEVPPTTGGERGALFGLGTLEGHGDVQATLSVLKEAKNIIAERVKKGVKGHKISDNPKRLFVLGSCVGINASRSEDAGAIVVGTDNHWSHVVKLVDEEGDPYYNLAKATLEYPYEQSIEKRAAWTVEQIKKSRADGVIFLHNWGCNTQAAISRAIVDVIKRETGLPTFISERELGGLSNEQEQNRVNAFVEML
ncbi:2-hydroxyglutaryl-CoA dehydratase, D-component [Ruminiclostridium hungatei]|uniref:2-hydroxyglutaryl-CoA dehydratase, D-component n=1 Tax=Ruminiclostridium hungatei TaxID=48256 RepID=A0A1V4SP11_RUMHU|nr:2-hydroxyacyl-CoA dehydratase family protein [Ruminiclostridium hungatei]OPX44977.1 2-hydroxyglutaryl-CoA dehydratase, D-component [Ruminiclostridium hungatei]